MDDTPPSDQKNDNQPASTIPPAEKTPEIYTIPASQSFLDSVARGILDQVVDDPLKLADYTILVPDRDARSALRKAFLGQLQGKTYVMPHISAPGDLDDEHLSLKIAGNKILSEALMDMPPAVSHLRRQLILAQEILKIPGMSSSTQKAIKLGGELGKFIDEAQRHGIELKDIEQLVPEAFKDQWAKTAEFLKIITETWPKKLQEMGRVDPEDHKNAVVQIQATHWMLTKPANPVIAVGFSDTSPATQSLLQAVANMPNGKLVFQGFDMGIDQQSWDAITPVHPQSALKSILTWMGIDRSIVKEWKAEPVVSSFARAPNIEQANAERQKLLREAMRPAGTAEGWTTLKGTKKKAAKIDIQALTGMDLITCGTPQEESSVIALKMRESLEVEGRHVTLVTPDRTLARRVSARLRTWNIDVRDSAGTPLSESPAGVYLLAIAAMAADEWAPVPFLEALKHPLAAMGEDKNDFRRKLAELEDLVFHGPRPGIGADGVKGALTATFNRIARSPKKKQTPEQLQAAQKELQDFIGAIQKAGKPFFDKMASETPVPFRDILDEHIRFAEALAADNKTAGTDRLWCGDDGVKAAQFLTELRDVAPLLPDVTGRSYVDVLAGLMRDVTVRSKKSSHPTLRIMPPEQAKFLKTDIVIIGGLNDEVWPRRVNENPWLSPDMIKSLGLPAPENDIGHMAHNFVQLASNPNVVLTRAMRSGEGPSVSSPFLTRLMMVLRGTGLEKTLEKKTRLLDIHTAMHQPAQVTPIEAPNVMPSLDIRPKQLPVTAIEMLMRDPYSVYAKYILNLRPKAPLDASPGVAERGIFTHDALDAFVKKYPDKLPPNAEEELLKIGEETFRDRMNNPTVRAFWWPRFERIAKWFVKFEAERRATSKVVGTEVRGKLEIDMGDEIFTLTAIADRIERGSDDQLTIIDYKTGSVPSQKTVANGFSPQLTLEALIAFSGGFDGIDANDVGELQYWKLSGGRPAAEVTDVNHDVKQLVNEAREGVQSLVKAFNDEKTPYLVTPRPDLAPRYNSYHHLSRVAEWSTVKKTAAQKKAPKTTRPRTTANKGKGKR